MIARIRSNDVRDAIFRTDAIFRNNFSHIAREVLRQSATAATKYYFGPSQLTSCPLAVVYYFTMYADISIVLLLP